MKYLPWILCVMLGLALVYSLGREREAVTITDIVRIDSIVHDTEFIERPVPVYVEVVRHDTVLLESVRGDSVDVVIPIESREYKDSSFHAWVSGYNSSLDSIEVYPSTVYMTRTVTERKRNRFGIGLQAGYGYPVGAYVGIGVSYNIFSW